MSDAATPPPASLSSPAQGDERDGPVANPEDTGPVSIAAPEDLPALRGMLARLLCPGFDPPPRLVIAVETDELRVLAASALRILEVRPAPAAAFLPQLPRAIGTLWLGEHSVLELIGLPLDEAFSPTWGLALPGAVGVLRAAPFARATLQAHCEAAEIRMLDVEPLLGRPLNMSSPAQLAALVRSAVQTLLAGTP